MVAGVLVVVVMWLIGVVVWLLSVGFVGLCSVVLGFLNISSFGWVRILGFLGLGVVCCCW